MSDPVPVDPVVDPEPVEIVPQPIDVDPTVTPEPSPYSEFTDTPTIINTRAPNKSLYSRHTIDEPYDGWVYNGTARILLHGQTMFELVEDGSPLTFGTPPDLVG